jgi:hypothetical protein
MEDLKHWYRRNGTIKDEITAEAVRIIKEHTDIYEKFKTALSGGSQKQQTLPETERINR